MSKKVNDLYTVISSCQTALAKELDKAGAKSYEDLEKATPPDVSARYWLMQFLEPLNRKELKDIVNGFMLPLMNDDQCKKLVKFLVLRFPQYYKGEAGATVEQQPEALKEIESEDIVLK